MQFPLIHGNMIAKEYEWKTLLNKSLTHLATDLTINGNPSTLIIFKETSKPDKECNDLQS